MSWRAAKSLVLMACLLAVLRCGSSPSPSTGASARAASESAAAASAADEVAVFLENRLGLSPDQREKTRRAALALIERNAKLADDARTKDRRVLEPLRQSQARFDTEILSILTSDQMVTYSRLKQDFHQTVRGRPPFTGLSSARPAGLAGAPPAGLTTPSPTVTP